MKPKTGILAPHDRQSLLRTLQTRFENATGRHSGIAWTDVQARLETHPHKLWSLAEMERTGGEPDVVARDASTGAVTFFDCSPESPAGRRSLCFDRAGLLSRKDHLPVTSAQDAAAELGITLLTEAQYRHLQTLGAFDTKTSSWIQTPEDIRALGGALFADRRYGHVFVYHNGAGSYYAARGFRGALTV